ncbi:trypsin-like serine peptidase [Rhizobium sp. C4]|uniref:trypsin-like serine peptidase n=1 Tax=Rhizobium sp. C4 TaxID=1349800 RepID=UPI001E2D6C8F|nr:serine protease [Rhizobium sp. C4]MCD2175971.1 serine protease [Rhizobium sp. C4]
MADLDTHHVEITTENPALSALELSWGWAEFSAEDGLGPLGSMYEAGDALVAVARSDKDGMTIIGSGVMVAPGILLTATHVLQEFSPSSAGPLFLTFLPGAARAWLPFDVATISKQSEFDGDRKIYSDVSLVSCTLNSDALPEFPLGLATMQIALPLVGERLWAIGFRHQHIENGSTLVTPMVSSGLVTEAFPHGRGERLASPCFEVNMDTLGGMSGGAVVNSEGRLVGIVSSSFAGGPSYVTLIWEALRLETRGTIPKLKNEDRVSLLAAEKRGVAKLIGDVKVKPWGDLQFRFSKPESELFARSIANSPSETDPDRYTKDKIDEFLEKWGSDMEDVAGDAAISALQNMTCEKVGQFIAGEVPDEWNTPVTSFSVEDFEGVEDPEVISILKQDHETIEIDLFFDLHTVVWTVQVAMADFQERRGGISDYFINIDIGDEEVSLDLVQRVFFRVGMIFDVEAQVFSDVTVRTASVRRRAKRVAEVETG